MSKGTRWGCECGAVWKSEGDQPPTDRMCSPACPKPPLKPLLALVVGSREWPAQYLWFVTQQMIELVPGWTIRSGGARGVDRHAVMEAIRLKWPWDEMKADWRPGGVYNPNAGKERNTAMLDKEPRPSLVLAFQHEGSSGTQDTIDKARERGIAVRVFTKDDMRPDLAALDYEDEPISLWGGGGR